MDMLSSAYYAPSLSVFGDILGAAIGGVIDGIIDIFQTAVLFGNSQEEDEKQALKRRNISAQQYY